MADVKFGFSQILEKTPVFIKRLRMTLTFISGGIVVYIPEIAAHFHTSTDTVSSVIGLSIIGVNAIGIMFGVAPESSNQ